MQYIVVEEFNDELSLAIEDGKPFITDNVEDAEDVLSQLQGGYVLPLFDIISLARMIVNNPDKMNASVEVQFELNQLL